MQSAGSPMNPDDSPDRWRRISEDPPVNRERRGRWVDAQPGPRMNRDTEAVRTKPECRRNQNSYENTSVRPNPKTGRWWRTGPRRRTNCDLRGQSARTKPECNRKQESYGDISVRPDPKPGRWRANEAEASDKLRLRRPERANEAGMYNKPRELRK